MGGRARWGFAEPGAGAVGLTLQRGAESVILTPGRPDGLSTGDAAGSGRAERDSGNFLELA
jgi:hypothetical protein